MPNKLSYAASWFDVPEHADVLIKVGPDLDLVEPCTKKAKTGAGTQVSTEAAAAPPVRSYRCHAVILSMHSGYFKAQLSSPWQQAAGSFPPAAGTQRTVDILVEAGQMDAMHELLYMMYSQVLPPAAAPGKPLFLQCLSLADRFEAASCMELLLTALQAVPSHDMTYEVQMYILQASPGVKTAPAYPALLASATKALLRLFGDVSAVIKDNDLLQQFCALPHAILLTWVQSDELRVESENCVVFLLSAWVKANQDSTTAQHEELAHQIRVFNLGPAYLHHILPNLSWFKGCSGMQHLAAVQCCKSVCIIISEGGEQGGGFGTELGWPAAWMAKPRRPSSSPRSGSWVLSPDQVKELRSGIGQYLSPPVYVNGFLMAAYMDQVDHVSAAGTPSKDPRLYRGADTALMEQWGVPVPRNAMLPVGPTLVHVGEPCRLPGWTRSVEAAWAWRDSWGQRDVLGVSAPTLVELMSFYLHEGRLHVQATFSGVDAAQ